MKEQTLSSKTIYSGKIINLRLEEVLLADGKTSTREIVEHPGAVAIIPVFANNDILLVRQYRKPVEQILYELPAGKLGKDEDPLACAQRELLEETGYSAREVTKIFDFYTTPGFSNEIMHIFLAQGLSSGSQNLDGDEFIQVERMPLNKLLAMVKNGEIKDAKTIIGILYLAKQKNGDLHDK